MLWCTFIIHGKVKEKVKLSSFQWNVVSLWQGKYNCSKNQFFYVLQRIKTIMQWAQLQGLRSKPFLYICLFFNLLLLFHNFAKYVFLRCNMRSYGKTLILNAWKSSKAANHEFSLETIFQCSTACTLSRTMKAVTTESFIETWDKLGFW